MRARPADKRKEERKQGEKNGKKSTVWTIAMRRHYESTYMVEAITATTPQNRSYTLMYAPAPPVRISAEARQARGHNQLSIRQNIRIADFVPVAWGGEARVSAYTTVAVPFGTIFHGLDVNVNVCIVVPTTIQ